MSCQLCGRPLRDFDDGPHLCRRCDERVMDRAENSLFRPRTAAAEPDWERRLATMRAHRRPPAHDFW